MFTADTSLHFKADGSFRILYLSDFQETYDAFDPRTLKGVNAVLDAEKPDLVVLCGDNCNGPEIHSAEDLEKYLHRMLEPFVTRGIPWCHVNGNHDYDAQVPMKQQFEIYSAIPGCMTQTEEDIPGTTNFVLPVYASDKKEIITAVWGLDTGHSINEIRDGLQQEALIPGLPLPASIWNILRFEQLMWYWQTSCALQAQAGHSVPGALAMHVSPWEFDYMRRFSAELNVCGNTDESYGLGAFNSGIFAALVQRGDIKCVLTGHTHRNTCEADYCGIRMCSVGSAGYAAYGEDSLRGGRIVEIRQTEPEKMTTRMLYFCNYIQQ